MNAIHFSTPANKTQHQIQCADLGIELPQRDLAVLHIHDAEWWIWKFSGGKRKFESTLFETLNAMSDEELDALYAQRFRELQLIYAPDYVQVSESEPSVKSDTPKRSPSPQKPPKPLPRTSPTDHKSSHINWDELAPQIIEQVALRVAQEANRPIFHHRKASEIRIGNNGSLSVDVAGGQFYDHDEQRGGRVVTLVMSELKLDKAGAMRWLDRHGFLTDSYTASNAPRIKPKPTRKSKSRGSVDRGKYDFGRRLWQQATPIPRSVNHPARRWAAQRNLLPPYVPFPPVIRYGVYADHKRGDRPYIIAFVCTLDALAEVYPTLPNIEPLKVRWQTLWIDFNGNSVDREGNPVKRGGLKNLYGGFGNRDDYPVMCLGDPTADDLALCEGIADALAIYSRCRGTVAAVLGSPNLTERSHLLECLARAGRTVTLFSDLDAVDGANKLGAKINSLDGRARRMDPNAKDPADAASLDPFPVVNRTKFDTEVASCRQAGSSEPERDAWFSVVEGGGSRARN